MKKFFAILLMLGCFVPNVYAKQILPETITTNTITISVPRTGELGKNYFFCASGSKCSTEQVVREYYTNSGYKIMRAEYSFWQGMFVLAFLDEFYPQTLNTKEGVWFSDRALTEVSDKEIKAKCKLIRKTNLKEFINIQLTKHEQGSYIRWLDEWEIEGYNNPAEYFKSSLVQEFLSRIDNKTFLKILKHILSSEGHNPVGTPDYIVWNDKEMTFVEVKRKNEKLSPEQIKWGEFLIKNKIKYKVIRVGFI